MTEYEAKIEKCKEIKDELSVWESGFFFGDGEDSRGISEFDNLSSGQKRIIDRVYGEKVEGNSGEAKVFQSGIVKAEKDTSGKFQLSVDGNLVNPKLNERDASIVVYWLADALTEIVSAVSNKEGVKAEEADDFPV